MSNTTSGLRQEFPQQPTGAEMVEQAIKDSTNQQNRNNRNNGNADRESPAAYINVAFIDTQGNTRSMETGIPLYASSLRANDKGVLLKLKNHAEACEAAREAGQPEPELTWNAIVTVRPNTNEVPIF